MHQSITSFVYDMKFCRPCQYLRVCTCHEGDKFFSIGETNLFHKSQKTFVPYPTMLHSEQKWGHFCSEWGIVGCRTSVYHDTHGDVMKLKSFPYYWPFVRESTGHWYIPPVASDADLWLSFQVGQKNCWTNNLVASDLRGLDAHVTS